MSTLLALTGANGQTLTLPHVEYHSILPELIIGVGAIVLLLLSSVITRGLSTRFAAWSTVVIALASIVSDISIWKDISKSGAHSSFAAAIAYDHFAAFFGILIASALALTALISMDWLESRGRGGVEYFVLMMLSATGAMFMAASNDLIIVFLGLEILSISLYVLTGFNRAEESSREAAMKYLILGGFSSAVFLYGIALTYGATGTTNLTAIATFLSGNTLLDNGLLLAGMGLLIVGFGFKVAAVPFQQWTPDVYQGAPTPVTGFMAAVAKAGAFAALLRVLGSTLYTLKLDWQPVILALALVTLLLGSIVACVQLNVKRMLAYSSISHAGYILLGLQAGNRDGAAGALFYLLAYSFIVVGSFAIVAIVGGQSSSNSGLDAFRGLGRKRPGMALCFTVLLLAQAGVPLTSGFLAKFYVISALVSNGSYATAVIAMLTAAIAAFFYLRIVLVMYQPEGDEVPSADVAGVVGAGSPQVVFPAATQAAVIIAVALTLFLGIDPAQHLSHYSFNVVHYAQQAADDLFTQ